jgi:hypothetical protein
MAVALACSSSHLETSSLFAVQTRRSVTDGDKERKTPIGIQNQDLAT